MIRTWLPACQLKQDFLVTSKAGTWRRKCGILFTSFLLNDFALDLAFPKEIPPTPNLIEKAVQLQTYHLDLPSTQKIPVTTRTITFCTKESPPKKNLSHFEVVSHVPTYHPNFYTFHICCKQRWLVWMLAEGSKGHKLLEVLGPTHLQDARVDISRSCKVSPVARWANELHLGVKIMSDV